MANGTRRQLIDEKDPLNRLGTSGPKRNGNINRKAVETAQGGLSGFEADIAGGTGVPTERFKRIRSFIGKKRTAVSDPTDIAGERLSQSERVLESPLVRKAARGVDIGGKVSPAKLGKPIRRDIISERVPGGTVRPGKKTDTRGTAVLTSISADERTGKGGFTDLGTFRRGDKAGGPTLRDEAGQKKQVSPFSAQGIREIFGSAASLAKTFASPEFQERKAKGIQQAAGRKGARADAKAKTERIKALSGVIENLSLDTGNDKLIQSLQGEIQKLLAGSEGGQAGDGQSGLISRLKQSGNFSDEEIKDFFRRLG